MFKFTPLLLAALAGTSLLLTGALGRHTPSPAAPTFVAESAPVDATSVLDEVIARLQTPWLQLQLWQMCNDGEVAFEAEGRWLHGPEYRRRLELDIRGGRSSRLLVVCDGATFQQVEQVDEQPPLVSTWPLPDKSEIPRFLQEKGATDIIALFQRLRQGLQSPLAETGEWQGVAVVRISGSWQPCDLPADVRSRRPPRLCRIFVDAHTRWPLRVEWWTNADAAGVPVLQMEFRDPVTQPPSREECAQLFKRIP